MRGRGGSEGCSGTHGFPWQLPVVGKRPTATRLTSFTQQTKLPNVKVEAQEGMSGQPDGGAGADPLLPALHLLHHHRHPRPPLHPGLLPQSSCSRQRG